MYYMITSHLPLLVVDGNDQDQIQKALQLIYKIMPWLEDEDLWLISLLAAHGSLGSHADEPLNDGPGRWIVSLSINGCGVTMNFLKTNSNKVVMSFPLQHGDIAMFTGDARYRLLHRIDVHQDGITNTTLCYSHYTTTTTITTPTYSTTLLLLTEFTFYSHANHHNVIVQVRYQTSTISKAWLWAGRV